MTNSLYRLVEEESGAVLIEAAGLRGFFVDPDTAGSGNVLIVGPTFVRADLGRDLSDVEIRLVDRAGAVIGSYYVGRVRLADVEQGGDDLVATMYGHFLPYPAAGEIWARWASGVPLSRAEWVLWPPDAHASWLHVAQNAWFEAGKDARRYLLDDAHVFDSRNVFNEGSLYCELGESINGPGGYFGANLDGLADCLAFSRGSEASFRVVWQHFSLAQERLGAALVEPVVATLSEFGVEVELQ
ncbi:barstar family protein [Kribbella sp. NPDC020789]